MNTDELNLIIAAESMIRRVAIVGGPFMLKGSFITRQYFKDPSARIPVDLDWVYLQHLSDVDTARQTFNSWATKITELDMEAIDGVKFRSFTENSFWRHIDYAMAEDFPTVNTDCDYMIDKKTGNEPLFVDISFNLEITDTLVPLVYHPLRGESFIFPKTVPLSLQVSWKLHQTIVRARFKDIFDLTHLLEHPSFTESVRDKSIEALMKECLVSNVSQERILWLFSGQLEKLYPAGSLSISWDIWRFDMPHHPFKIHEGNFAEGRFWHITTEEHVPESYQLFETQFYASLQKAGLTMGRIKEHPYMLGT